MAIRHILSDLTEAGLDPSKPHTVDRSRLKRPHPVQEVAPSPIEPVVVEPEVIPMQVVEEVAAVSEAEVPSSVEVPETPTTVKKKPKKKAAES